MIELATLPLLIWTTSPEGMLRVLPMQLSRVAELVLCALIVPSPLPGLLRVRGFAGKLRVIDLLSEGPASAAWLAGL